MISLSFPALRASFGVEQSSFHPLLRVDPPLAHRAPHLPRARPSDFFSSLFPLIKSTLSFHFCIQRPFSCSLSKIAGHPAASWGQGEGVVRDWLESVSWDLAHLATIYLSLQVSCDSAAARVEMLSVVENGLDPRAAIPVGGKGGSRVGKGCTGQTFHWFFSL